MKKEPKGPETKENPERNDDKLKAKEFEYMKDYVEGKGEERITPSSNLIHTPAEHFLYGSSLKGAGYHPNMPLLAAGEPSLDKINEAREGSGEIPLTLAEGEVLGQIHVELEPISQDQIESEDFEPTFKVKKVVMAEFVEKDVEISLEEAREYINERMRGIQKEARQDLERHL